MTKAKRRVVIPKNLARSVLSRAATIRSPTPAWTESKAKKLILGRVGVRLDGLDDHHLCPT